MVETVRRLVKYLLYDVLSAGNRNRYLELRGQVMDRLTAWRLYERRHLELLRCFVGTGDVAIDVGAHFGAYSRELARLTGPSGRVLAFEPLAELMPLLQRRLNALPQVELHRAALSDHDSDAEELKIPLLFGRIPEPALATFEAIDLPYERIEVPVKRLDCLAADVVGVRFIKVDVEGHELRFLRGARTLILRDRPVVQFEDNDIRARYSEYASLAADWGFQLCWLTKGSITPLLLEGLDTAERSGAINFFLVPSEFEVSRR